MGGNAWSHRDLFDAGNHFKGKEENLKHTITCQCTICNNNFQQAQSLDVRERSTARNKLAPQSQQDRLHPKEGTQKGSKSCLRVSKIDSIEESALQEIKWYLEVNKIDFIEMRTKKRKIGAFGSAKSTQL